ncbi:SF0329 family protein [Priestia megaterium]|uniref:SF0329 family protein n=1 Tax=Priestia megaterium TaxID=1404 RepID=UPI003F7F2DF3
MKWTKVKKNMENLFCDKLKYRLSIHLTKYNVSLGEQARIWITLDKKEIFNASSAEYLLEHDKLWKEVQRKTSNPFPECLYECFPEFIGKVSDMDYTASILEYRGIFNVDHVYEAFIQYPQLSIDRALNSGNIISQALALVDRRIGKRTLEALKYNSNVHPLIMQFYELRCKVENSKPS